ncbi:MAG: NAD(+) synthase [Bacilli bacterium]
MKIIPIKDLRNTQEISKLCAESFEPVFISKNGYNNLVIMSDKYYENLLKRNNNRCHEKIKSEIKPILKYKQYDGFGFVRVASINFKLKVGDVYYNLEQIKEKLIEANKLNIKIAVFPELALTGYTCSDLFFNRTLLNQVEDALVNLKEFSKNLDMLFFVGAPISKDYSIFNTAVAFNRGEIIGVNAKKYLPNYNEFYEARQFKPCPENNSTITIKDKSYIFGNRILYSCLDYIDLKVGVDICEDLWVNDSFNTELAMNGASVIVNLSASNEIVGKEQYRKDLVKITSARNICGYIYCSSGEDESTTDLIYSGAKLIYENGSLINEGQLFSNGILYTEIDIEKLMNERRRMTTFVYKQTNLDIIPFSIQLNNVELSRNYSQNPFILQDFELGKERYRKIIEMQARGLKKRLEACNIKKVVVGLSGGLDSTLALLVCYRCFEIMGYDYKDITAITLPCFGTSERTYNNALKLSSSLGLSFKEINICDSVLSHFKDINHDVNNHNTTYENAQARERTQVLLDYANDINALMVGTGDLSELCLGWTTYNGDHMSSYGVNASIPKTLVKELVKTFAYDYEIVKDILLDIIDTPISPELLPPVDGEISQKTEDKIGPYELHDFFIYHFLRNNFSCKKIFFLAAYTYKGKYTKEDIKKYLTLFIKRFFQNQFKRSVLPDGVKVGTVSISPRGDFRMPSDASYSSFLKEIDDIVID